MKKTYKTILMSGVAAISVAAFASCGDKKDNAEVAPETMPETTSSTDPAAATETVSLELSGLKGATNCPPKVRSALSKLDGVIVSDVTTVSAEIKVDRSKVTNDEIVKAIESADPGYSAKVK